MSEGIETPALCDSATLRETDALRKLLPFILEDYYPECATDAYRDAVESAKQALKESEDA